MISPIGSHKRRGQGPGARGLGNKGKPATSSPPVPGPRSPIPVFWPLAPHLDTRRGLTLIEVLVSVAILAAGAVLILQALATGAYTLNVARNRTQAYTFARSKMADLEMALRQGEELKTRGRFRMGREQYRWTLHSSATEDPEFELITLTVAWRQGQHDHESQFSTVRRIEPEEAL